jgi:uncharacterized protein YlzI (FlbEa/FlbD family)
MVNKVDTTATACAAFQWHGQSYTASGNYNLHISTVNGCPDTTILHLTINQGSHTDTTATACAAFQWHGQSYTASGNYNFISTVNGCPDTTILHLTINNGNKVDTTATACAEPSSGMDRAILPRATITS